MLVRIRDTSRVVSLCGLVCVPALMAATAVYQVTTVAGSDSVGDGGVALIAQLAQPEGLAIDTSGNIYVADAANHRVRKVTAAGTISTVAGNGHPGFAGDNGPAQASQLNQPYGLVLDPQGNLFVADYGNQRVRRIGTDGNITTIAGTGQSGSGGDGGQATAASFMGPRNLAMDAAGDLFVSEFDGHRVRRITPDGLIGTVAGTGIAGFSGDGGPATAAQLAYPAGLAVDGGGSLYIVDTFNVSIRKVRAGIISTVCNQQRFGMPYVKLLSISADTAGNLYIPEAGNSFVWRMNPAGVLARVAGTPGGGAYTGDGQPATQTALNVPADVALDSAGNLYISETRRVRIVIAATGIMNTVAGDGTFGFSGDGGQELDAVLNTPTGVAVWDGSIYIADQNNNRVRQVSAAGTITTVAGNGQASYAGDGLVATSGALNGPTSLVFDAGGNLYIADTRNNRVRRVDTTGVMTTFAGDGTISGFGGEGQPATLTPLYAPQGLVAGAAGDIYISDTGHDRVIRVDTTGNMHTVAGTGTPGSVGAGGTSSLPQLNGPTGLALDGAGNLYIADTLNHRVLMLAPDATISTIAGTSASGYSGDGGPAIAAALSYPGGVTVDANLDIYITDSGNNVVRLITPDGTIATIAGTGQAAYIGDSGAGLTIALSDPCGLAVVRTGTVLVADSGNNRVRSLTQEQTQITPPQLIAVTLANAASLQPGPLAPGEIFSIFGAGIGPAAASTNSYDASGHLPTTLGNVQVLFNTTPAPLFYVQAGQINAQVPYEMAGQPSAQLEVMYQSALVASTQVALADTSPALFTLNYGTGNAVVVNQDGTLNSDQNPAARGSFVVLYATGSGQSNPGGVTGQAAGAPYPVPNLPVSLTMAGISANVLWAGGAPGFVGLLQINAQVPSGFVPTGDLPLVLTVGPYQSVGGVTIAVK